jgi:hypothetical protein
VRFSCAFPSKAFDDEKVSIKSVEARLRLRVVGRLASALVLALTSATCGGGSPNPAPAPSPTSPTPGTPAPAPPPTVTPSGANWSFRPPGGPLRALEGSFDPSGGATTAVLAPFGSCFQGDSDRARFTGARSGLAIELQSQPLNGQVINMSGRLSPGGDMFEGAYSMTGSCSDGGQHPVIGRLVDLNGRWTGKLGAIPTVIDMHMAGTPDESAGYALSGSVTFSNTQCFPNASITRRARGRWLFPDIVSETQRLELIGQLSDDLSTMFVDYVLVAGTCPELSFGSGSLVRQQ